MNNKLSNTIICFIEVIHIYINMNNPIIKWIGGKNQIYTNILSKFPTVIENYFEPFIGGGSILYKLLDNKEIKINGKIFVSDLNETLINKYINIQKNPDKVIEQLNILKTKYEEKDDNEKENYYYEIRQIYNDIEQKIKNTEYGTSLFIFLNKTGFRGLYRENSKGKFNVPYGNYKHCKMFDKKHIKYISNLIKDVNFLCGDFKLCVEKINENDFVYFDPPYIKEKKTSFVNYTKDCLDTKLNEELINMCIVLNNKKIKFLLSNSYTSFVIDKFDKNIFVVDIVECRRRINSKNPSSKTNEVLITNMI